MGYPALNSSTPVTGFVPGWDAPFDGMKKRILLRESSSYAVEGSRALQRRARKWLLINHVTQSLMGRKQQVGLQLSAWAAVWRSEQTTCFLHADSIQLETDMGIRWTGEEVRGATDDSATWNQAGPR